MDDKVAEEIQKLVNRLYLQQGPTQSFVHSLFLSLYLIIVVLVEDH